MAGESPGDYYEGEHYGDELMYAGLITTDDSAGQVSAGADHSTDFESRIYILEAEV